jgi:hypothetical protein
MDASLNENIFVEDNPRLIAFIDECQKNSLPEIDKSMAEKWLDEVMKNNNFISSSARNFDKTYFLLVTKIQLDFKGKVWELLKHEYLNKHEKITAFMNICRHIGYKPVPKEIASEWFERVYQSKNTDEIHPEFERLIRMTIEADFLFERSFHLSNYSNWSFK